jgi:hypothetical protein
VGAQLQALLRPGLPDTLVTLLQKLLWLLGIRKERPDTEKHSQSKSKPRVMLSYNWDNQAIICKLAEALKNVGYEVWLDIEQMTGSTMEVRTCMHTYAHAQAHAHRHAQTFRSRHVYMRVFGDGMCLHFTGVCVCVNICFCVYVCMHVCA